MTPSPAPGAVTSPRWALAAAAASTVGIAALDLFLPSGLIVPMLYGLPLGFAALTRDRRLLLAAAAVALGLTFAVYFWPLARPTLPPAALALANRGLAAVMLLATAAALFLWVGSDVALVAERAALEEQNRELEAINEELGQREEEIVRQNEEL